MKLKLALALLLAAAVAFLGYSYHIYTQPDPDGVLILEYHLVQDEELPENDVYRVSVKDFLEQLDYLAEKGYTTISIRDFLRAKKGLETLPAKPVILTFDDGYKSNYSVLLPILEERKLKATIFMPTNFIGEERYMSWAELKDIQKRGVEIGSHTANHLDLEELTPQEVRDELRLSKLLMEWNGMETIYTFSYPHGANIEGIEDILKEEEYLAAVTGDAGINTASTNPYFLKRVQIPNPTFNLPEFKYRLFKAKFFAYLEN